MKFKINNEGVLLPIIEGKQKQTVMVQDKNDCHIIEWHRIKYDIKEMRFLDGKALSVTAPLVLGVASGTLAGQGIFWSTFMKYIFPYVLDISKVFCVIKIAQGFYEEHRGGKNSAGGFSSFVTWGKWLLLIHLIPWGVELIDELGSKMLNDMNR